MVEDNWQHRSRFMRCKNCMWYVEKKFAHTPREVEIGRCRRHAMLALVSRESERFDDDERRAAMQVEAMHQEIVAFFKAVREGKA